MASYSSQPPETSRCVDRICVMADVMLLDLFYTEHIGWQLMAETREHDFGWCE